MNDYSINMIIDITVFTVQLDTGSTDFWVFPNGTSLQTTNTTNLNNSLTYGTGTVSGVLEFAEVQLGSYTVPSQGECVGGVVA